MMFAWKVQATGLNYDLLADVMSWGHVKCERLKMELLNVGRRSTYKEASGKPQPKGPAVPARTPRLPESRRFLLSRVLE